MKDERYDKIVKYKKEVNIYAFVLALDLSTWLYFIMFVIYYVPSTVPTDDMSWGTLLGMLILACFVIMVGGLFWSIGKIMSCREIYWRKQK